MSDSDRHGYITLGWVATIVGGLLFFAIAESQYSDAQKSAEYAYKCAQQYKNRTTATGNVAPTPGEQERTDSAEKQQTGPDWCDLTAQQSMAESTYWMNWAAWSSVIFTGVAAFLIWRTLIATQETVAVTQRIGAAQTRAYISVTPDGINPLKKRNRVVGHVTVKNVGHSIAKSVHMTVRLTMSNNRELDDFTCDIASARPSGAIAPGAEIGKGSVETLPINDISPRHQPRRYVFVWGAVFYQDGFGKDRFTRFCHRYNCESATTPYDGDRVRVESGEWSIDPKIARYHETGNDAD